MAVNIDDKQADGEAFLNDLELEHVFPVFMPQESSAAIKSYDPAHMPSALVIVPDGVVRYVHSARAA